MGNQVSDLKGLIPSIEAAVWIIPRLQVEIYWLITECAPKGQGSARAFVEGGDAGAIFLALLRPTWPDTYVSQLWNSPFTMLAWLACTAWVWSWGHTLAGTSPKQLLPSHTWQAASVKLCIPRKKDYHTPSPHLAVTPWYDPCPEEGRS